MTYTAAEMREMAQRISDALKNPNYCDRLSMEKAAAMLRQAAEAMDAGVWISHEMNDFLHGAAQFDGTWFGERHREKKGAFWWRRLLPDSKASAALATPPAKD